VIVESLTAVGISAQTEHLSEQMKLAIVATRSNVDTVRECVDDFIEYPSFFVDCECFNGCQRMNVLLHVQSVLRCAL